jgi:hypothetical protein
VRSGGKACGKSRDYKGLHHLLCKEMQFLRVLPGNSPLEPIGVDHLYPGKGLARKMTEARLML